MITSDFYCTQCGNKALMLPRKNSRLKEPGHLKKLFCIFCQKENNCVEVRPIGTKYDYQDFLIEFKHNNFNPDGTRKLSYGELKKTIYSNKG